MLETMLKKQHYQAHDSLSSWQLAAQMLHDACRGVYHAIPYYKRQSTNALKVPARTD